MVSYMAGSGRDGCEECQDVSAEGVQGMFDVRKAISWRMMHDDLRVALVF